MLSAFITSSYCYKRISSFVQILVKDIGKDKDGNNSLFLAVKRGASLQEVEKLVNQGTDWETTDKERNTILHVAAEAGSLEAVKYFLQKGFPVETRNVCHSTPLLLAANAPKNFIQIVNVLVENGADIHAVQFDKCNVLLLAAFFGQSLEDLKELENRGVRWDILDKDGKNILHCAVQTGNLKALRHYISKGANVNAKSKEGITPHVEAVFSPKNSIEMVALLAENGADLQAVDILGQSAIYYSMRKPIGDIKALVELGCPWDKPNKEGQSIIHIAAEKGNPEAIEYFISLGANPNSKCQRGVTPLFMSFWLPEERFFKTVDILLRNGATISNANADDQQENMTVLQYAVKMFGIDEFLHRVSLGADVNAKNKCGATRIMYPCPKSTSVVRALIDLVAGTRQTDNQKYTIIDDLVRHGVHETELLALFKMGLAWILENEHRESVLHLAASSGNLEALRYFIDKEDVNKRDSLGRTPLMQAMRAKKSFIEIVDLLIDNGADVGAVDNRRKDVMLYAVYRGKGREELEHLINRGVIWNRTYTDRYGSIRSILDVAEKIGNEEAVSYFLSREMNANFGDAIDPLLFAV